MRAPVARPLKKSVVCFRGVALIGLLIVLAGCGGIDPEPPEVDVKVNHTITTVSQAAGDAEEFKYLFAEGVTVPEADRAKYAEYFFYAKSPEISGNSCTAMVTVQDLEGKDLTEVQWTLELKGETWKLKTAPLP